MYTALRWRNDKQPETKTTENAIKLPNFHNFIEVKTNEYRNLFKIWATICRETESDVVDT